MKPEVRILVSSCKGDVCFSFIVRAPGIDGAVATRGGCSRLCSALREKGYLGELRFHLGDCSCGLPIASGLPRDSKVAAEAYLMLAGMVVEQLARLLASS